MVMNAKSPGQKPPNTTGGALIMTPDEHDMYNNGSIKPLKRNKMKRDNSEDDLHGPGSLNDNENGQYPQFNQKYQPGMPYNDH